MRRNVLIVVVAVLFGLAAAVVSVAYLRSARSDIAAQNQPVEVLVAQQDLPQGMTAEELFAKGLVKLEQVPQRFVARDALSSERAVENQVLAVAVSTGEQLTATRFTYPSDAGLSYSVPDDLVAISIEVDDVTGVAGLLKPGDSVIVFASFKPDGGLGAARTDTLIPKARVLAVGGEVSAAVESADAAQSGKSSSLLGAKSGSGETYTTVTLALSSEDAARVAFARQYGSIQLALLAQTAPGDEPPSTIVFGRGARGAKSVTE